MDGMSRDLTWFAVNNDARAADAPGLAAFGVRLRPRSSEPVTVQRDPVSGRLIAELGAVQVIRGGDVNVRPRHDCPPVGLDVLVSTALECVERDLHIRDAWEYRRATAKRHGYWHTTVCIALPEGTPLFAAQARALAAAPTVARDASALEASHPRA